MHRVLCVWFVAASAIVAHAEDMGPVAPMPGRDKVEPTVPDWCGSYTPKDPNYATHYFYVESKIQDRNFEDQTLRRLAEFACEAPEDKDLQARVAIWRQTWINYSGVSEKDDRIAMKLRIDQATWEQQQQTFCASLEGTDEASPEEKAIARARLFAHGCPRQQQIEYLGWWVDKRTAVQDQVVRAAFLWHCLRGLIQHNQDWPDAKSAHNMARFATCGPDARRLERQVLETQISAADYNDYARVTARETWSQAKATHDYLADAYKKVAKDEAYQQLLFDAPEAGWTGWEKDYEANKAAIEAALQFEEKFYGPSRKALKGCGATLRKNAQAYVQARKPTSIAQVRSILREPVGFTLWAALTLCDATEGRFILAEQQASQLRRNEKGDEMNLRDTRGPRLAAYYAAVAALAETLADRERFPVAADSFRPVIEPPDEQHGDHLMHAAYNLWANKVHAIEAQWGEIKTFKKEDAGHVATFKTISWMADTWDCRFTNKLERIEPNGQLVYEQICTRTGKHKESKTEHAIVLHEEVSEKLKPSLFGLFQADSINTGGANAPYKAFPVEVYTASDKKTLVMALGIPL